MSANVETMFSVREKPWHGLGEIVQEAPTSIDAIRLAGLDWDVTPKPVYADGIEIPGYKANIRSDNGKALGIVSNRYKIVQNREAFDFTDALLEMDEVTYETAGSLAEGKRVWLMARMPDFQMVGEDMESYLLFTNSHDGKGSIRSCVTNVRVVCQNTLNLALGSADRMWSTKHTGNMAIKMEEAKTALDMAGKYNEAMKEQAEKWAENKLYEADFLKLVEELFPLPEETSLRVQNNILDAREEFITRYTEAPDLQQFKNTEYAFIQAVSDFAYHSVPKRMTDTYNENRFAKAIDGHPLMDKAIQLLSA